MTETGHHMDEYYTLTKDINTIPRLTTPGRHGEDDDFQAKTHRGEDKPGIQEIQMAGTAMRADGVAELR